ncbi:MAG: hypothetical protein CME26_02725 [Gemmatimonadetes bacterium]|nr:hypothetical protein [Gemmatimonadota bacterium]|tara:strand:+ start:13080 stop:15299 length:2220 start_codon:yes stop_codon:yes gene_type:complete
MRFPGTNVELKIISSRDGVDVQCMEEQERYEYELDTDSYNLNEIPGVVIPSRINRQYASGVLAPGSYVGSFKLTLVDRSAAEVSHLYVEVHSKKLAYESEYRAMLEDIAEKCTDLLLRVSSPAEQTFVPDRFADESTLAQRLYFLLGLLGGQDFRGALDRLIAFPNTQWSEEQRTVDLHQVGRPTRAIMRQISSATPRRPTPTGHPLEVTFPSLPSRVERSSKQDTVDTPENRFVKFVLQSFLGTLGRLLDYFHRTARGDYPRLENDILQLVADFEETLTDSFFKHVAPMTSLPLSSVVLQQKDGYRQVLRAWSQFQIAARLTWAGGDDVYRGGKKDAAILYEYWVYFRLLDLVSEVFEFDQPPIESLLNQDEFTLRLKSGRHVVVGGIYRGMGRTLQVEFSYNRTFPGGVGQYPEAGSWTRSMRPDYSLSLWPAGVNKVQAENQELVTHVHFDAKYRVDSLLELFGTGDDDLEEDRTHQRRSSYQRADLLKMHSYRDAIRRTAGAYVIYPGTEGVQFSGYHELLPGLGAFALRPDSLDDGSDSIQQFLREVVANVCDRGSHRELQSYYTHKIHATTPDPVLKSLSEVVDGSRVVPPTETFVLLGWIRGPDHLEWIKTSLLYNFRAEDRRGSLRLSQTVSAATYLLLHGEGERRSGGRLLGVKGSGPRVFSSELLEERGYPYPASGHYLVFDVNELESDDPLNGYDWDLAMVPGSGSGRQSGLPFGVALSQLMKGAIER